MEELEILLVMVFFTWGGFLIGYSFCKSRKKELHKQINKK